LGHEIAWQQFKLPNNTPQPKSSTSNLPELSMKTDNGMIKIEGQNFSLTIDLQKAKLTDYQYKNTALILSLPTPNFWRPPTDNDLGNGMQDWAAVWKKAGQEAETKMSTPTFKNKNTITFQVQYVLADSLQAKVLVEYSIYGNGEILIEYQFIPKRNNLPKIPRVGLQMKIPADFQFMQWYGRGPHETYWDRKSSGEIALWKGTVWEQLHQYSRPQETANKTDVRWMSLTNQNGVGIKIKATTTPLSMSAWPLAMEDLDYVAGKKGAQSASGLVPVTSKHGADLFPKEFITWNIDFKQMGVGGDTSWGRLVHKEYTLPVSTYQYAFRWIPFENE